MRNGVRFLMISLVFLAGCAKDPDTNPVKPGSPDVPANPARLSVEFLPLANGETLVFDSKTYVNVWQDSFTVTKFNYYISNVELITADGKIFKEPESYHLIQHAGGSQTFTIQNLPAAKYTNMRFLIGVDSARNVSGVQSGDLDPAKLMFWDWNTGYIFYKLEGSYHSVMGQQSEYAIHIGGFSQPYSRIRQVTMPVSLEAKNNATLRLKMGAEVTEVFHSPNDMGFDTYYNGSMTERKFIQVSENYSDMFSVISVQ